MSQSSGPVNKETRANVFMVESVLSVVEDVGDENGEHGFEVLTKDPFFLQRPCPSVTELSRVVYLLTTEKQSSIYCLTARNDRAAVRLYPNFEVNFGQTNLLYLVLHHNRINTARYTSIETA